jgi:hypothetical protein
MSEQVRNNPKSVSIQRDLAALISSLQPSYSPMEKIKLLAELAHRLSRMADKNPVWGWRYIHGVANGTLEASPRFIYAVKQLTIQQVATTAMQISGQPARIITVNAIAKVRPGAFILSPSRPCENPTCTIHFVPRVPWQKYCPRCRLPKRKRSRRTSGR